MTKFRLLFLLIMLSLNGYGQYQRNLLQNAAASVDLSKELISSFSELGFPTYQDRQFWNKLPEALRGSYIKEAENYLNYSWPVIKATDYLDIIRSGDRNSPLYAAPRSALNALVMGELVEGQGRFLDQIINGCWYYSEQTWWGWSAHLKHQKAPHGLPDKEEPLLDLGVGEVTNILSWTWYLFHDAFDEVHPLIAERLKSEIFAKAINPFYERNDFWWQGLTRQQQVNNWVPWVNFNMLTAILILEDDQTNQINGVRRVLEGLDVYLNQIPEDGGCDEGPSYWGHAGAKVYRNLELLNQATQGKLNIFDDPLIQNLGRYIYKVHINYPYFINFADADAKTSSYPYVVYSYGKAIHDPVMQSFGAYMAMENNWGTALPEGNIDAQIHQLMLLDEIKGARAESALLKDFYLPETDVAGARDQGGSIKGFYFAAKGGNNGENHNHNDIGSCVMYYDGKPCLIDVGRETYVAQTFSNERYEIWTMQSQYHNTPTINGQDQSPGASYKASRSQFHASSRKTVFQTDIAGAYPGAGINKWERTYTLVRGKSFRIKDEFAFSNQPQAQTSLNLITYCKVTEEAPGMLKLDGDGFTLSLKYDPERVIPAIEFIEVTDDRLDDYWPQGVTRMRFHINQPGVNGSTELLITPGL